MRKLNVMVIFGGKSGEHEVSLMSATSILNVMDRDKYNIIPVGITKEGIWKLYNGPIEEIVTSKWEELGEDMDLFSLSKDNREKVDIVFPVLHGPFGEDGRLQGLLEMLNLPYVGAGVLASSVGMDKVVTKQLASFANIPQAKYIDTIENDYRENIKEVITNIETQLGYPVFVKPANLGSSVGISKAKNREELIEAIELAFEYDRKIVVEEGINAREIECSVLGNDEPKASVLAEIIPGKEFYDYEDKYIDGNSRFEIPANIPKEITVEIQNLAIKVYKLLNCTGLARVDFFVEKVTNKIYFNEINTMPGFTQISMYPKMWEATGIKYKDLIDKLIDLGIKRFK